MLNICANCTTAFAVGVDHCPQCGNADYYPEGTLPKITRHHGATLEGEQRPDETESTVAEPDPVDSPDVPVAPPGEPYDTWLKADLENELAERQLPTSGNKPELVQRLIDDDANKAKADEVVVEDEDEPDGFQESDGSDDPEVKPVF